MKRLLTLLAVFVALGASACTNLLVGKKASKNGECFITYSADSYGMYGRLLHYAAGHHAAGTMRKIVDGDSHKPLGEIPEAPVTYNVVGNINEHQVAITETTFGGREELWPKNPTSGIDYVSLMALGLQRSKTAREAIRVMTDLVARYGYASEGESFSIADPNEAWIMEMIGKGDARQGAVWVAVRIPDDCISAHANQSRIHRFDLKDKKNVMYAKDVISFARSKGYFNGRNADFSFSDAYAPADFSALRFCEARVWSLFNHFVSGMEKYVPFVDGRHIGTSEVMPLYFKPDHLLSLQDVMNAMRDHYEGTPFDNTQDIGAGVYGAPYRPSPLTWEQNGKKYFNERPVSTHQASFVIVCELRSSLPNAIGGIIWFANDDANMTPFVPIYCSLTEVPECFADGTANDHTFSWKSAFWLCNWVSNMVYPRYSQMFPSVQQYRNRFQQRMIDAQAAADRKLLAQASSDGVSLTREVNALATTWAGELMNEWKALGEYLIMKYNDQVVKKETPEGKWELTPNGICVDPQRPGYPEPYRKALIRATGDKYLVPASK